MRARRRNAPLTASATVCAVVPHHRCEEWLGDALDSLLAQTRRPDAIVVVDDGSDEPPIDLVGRHPGVTLLSTVDNGGPYRAVQAVIDRVAADAFVFQDADDWSAPDRLEVLLETAGATGAELVGSHEVRVIVDDDHVLPVRYPLDVNAALRERADAFPLLHPTSLISRRLVRRIGGFATGLRFSGDEELLRRAAHVARIVNADHFGYFRRKRPGSLTTEPATALGSPARRRLQAELTERARRDAEVVAGGGTPDLRPWRVAPPASLRLVAGPDPSAWPTRRRRPRRPAVRRDERGVPPVFVIGAPRAGQVVLGWALGQHRALRLADDPESFARTVAGLGPPAPNGSNSRRLDRLAEVLLETAAPPPGRPVVAGAALTGVARSLVAWWPDARVVHLVRHPDQVAASLAAAPVEGGTFVTADRSYERWLDDVAAGLALERTLGPGAVLRLSHQRLIDEPDAALTEVLGFIGVANDEAATAAGRFTLAAFGRPPDNTPPTASAWLVERARAAWRRLDEPGGSPAPSPNGPGRATPPPARSPGGETLPERFRSLVEGAVPGGAVVAVISRGDPELIRLDGREGRHFPSTDDGVYTGFHPADGADVLARLRRARHAGATHLAVPATAFWWLDHYDGLAPHLTAGARLTAYAEDTGAIWVLEDAPATGERRPRTWAMTMATTTRSGR